VIKPLLFEVGGTNAKSVSPNVFVIPEKLVIIGVPRITPRVVLIVPAKKFAVLG
jgi:hypothetical protein